MIRWWGTAQSIFQANLISFMLHKFGLCAHPIMAQGPEGPMIAIEAKQIVAGWEL